MLKRRRSRRPKIVKRNCNFCKEQTNPTYRELEVLRRFIAERGKIVPQSRNGLCRKHQRKVTLAIKHARHLALLPFISRA